jgi:hypothetical protein
VATSDEWRVIGYFDFGGGPSFYLHDGTNPRILVTPPNYKLTAHTAEVFLPTGDVVTNWAGGKARPGLIEQSAGAK